MEQTLLMCEGIVMADWELSWRPNRARNQVLSDSQREMIETRLVALPGARDLAPGLAYLQTDSGLGEAMSFEWQQSACQMVASTDPESQSVIAIEIV